MSDDLDPKAEREAIVRYLEAWASSACNEREAWAVRTVARGVAEGVHAEPKPSPVEAAWAAFSVDLDALRADPAPLRVLLDAIDAEKRQDAERVTWQAWKGSDGWRVAARSGNHGYTAGPMLSESYAVLRAVLRPEAEASP